MNAQYLGAAIGIGLLIAWSIGWSMGKRSGRCHGNVEIYQLWNESLREKEPRK